MSSEKTVLTEKDELSIEEDGYDRWLPNRSRILVLVALFALLGPISTTMYLPSLVSIKNEMKTDDFMVTLTIAPFYLVLGIMPLIFGPICDRYGRRYVILAGLFLNGATTIGCGLATNIEMLIGLRVIQAIGVSILPVVGTGVISDIYPPEIRGNALGMYTISPSVGPLLGPIFGGTVANFLNWRWIFWISSIVTGIFFIACLLLLPETLSRDAGARPLNPLKSLKFLLNPVIFTMGSVNGLVFGMMVGSLTFIPVVLGERFGLNELETGLCYIPYGVSSIASSKIGGILSDWGQRNHGYGGRIVGTFFSSFYFWPFTVLLSVATDLPLFLVAIGAIGFCFSFQRPGVYSYSIQQYPKSSSAVSASILAMQYTFGSLTTFLGPLAWDRGFWTTIYFFIAGGCLGIMVDAAVAYFVITTWNQPDTKYFMKNLDQE